MSREVGYALALLPALSCQGTPLLAAIIESAKDSRHFRRKNPGPAPGRAVSSWEEAHDNLHPPRPMSHRRQGPLNPAFFRAATVAIDTNDYIVYDQGTGGRSTM